MYDSPRTKLFKEVFSNPDVFKNFYKIIDEFSIDHSLPRLFERQVMEIYNDLKKEIRKHYKEICNNCDLKLENSAISETCINVMKDAISNFANKFNSNRAE